MYEYTKTLVCSTFPLREKILIVPNKCISLVSISLFVHSFTYRQLWRKWDGGFQRYVSQGRDLHRPLLQNLQQCWGAELWQVVEEAQKSLAQGPGGSLLLWRHDSERSIDGHETLGSSRRVSASGQVSGNEQSDTQTLPLFFCCLRTAVL